MPVAFFALTFDEHERRMREIAAQRAHVEDMSAQAGERALANVARITEQLPAAIAYVERAETLGSDELRWCRWAVSQIALNVPLAVTQLEGTAAVIASEHDELTPGRLAAHAANVRTALAVPEMAVCAAELRDALLARDVDPE